MLEIGCGFGRHTRALAEVFREVVAIDVSGEMIKRACTLNADLRSVRFIETNGRDLSALPDSSFDLVFSYIVLGHIPEKEIVANYFRETHRVLKGAGLFLINLPLKVGVFSQGWLTLAWAFGFLPVPRFLVRLLPDRLIQYHGYFRCRRRIPASFRRLTRLATYTGALYTEREARTMVERAGLTLTDFLEDRIRPHGTSRLLLGWKKK